MDIQSQEMAKDIFKETRLKHSSQSAFITHCTYSKCPTGASAAHWSHSIKDSNVKNYKGLDAG